MTDPQIIPSKGVDLKRRKTISDEILSGKRPRVSSEPFCVCSKGFFQKWKKGGVGLNGANPGADSTKLFS